MIGDSCTNGCMMYCESNVAEDDIPQCPFVDLVDEVLDESDIANYPRFTTDTRLSETPVTTSSDHGGQEKRKVKRIPLNQSRILGIRLKEKRQRPISSEND